MKKNLIVLIGIVCPIIISGFIFTSKTTENEDINQEIVPYINTITQTDYNRNINGNVNTASRGDFRRKAEDVWAEQDGKFFKAEDRYTNDELAEMILSGKTSKVERIINIDQYDRKALDVAVDKMKKNQSRVAVAGINYTENNKENTSVIKAFPHNSTFKSYMPWTALSASSPQGKLCAKAIKDSETAIMTYEDRYLVALGFAYADYVGQKIDVVMESGQVIPVMIGDFKALEHTDDNNSSTVHDGSIIEFIVSNKDEAGKAVNGSGNYNSFFPGKIKEFRKLN